MDDEASVRRSECCKIKNTYSTTMEVRDEGCEASHEREDLSTSDDEEEREEDESPSE